METEKRLIYADDAKQALMGWDTDPTDEDIEYTIDKLPTVDAVEVVHGRWILREDGYHCSHCDIQAIYTGVKLNYCPNCGAKMDRMTEE